MFRMKLIYLEPILLLLLRPQPAFSSSGFMSDFFKKFPALPGFRDSPDSLGGYLDTIQYMHSKRELPLSDTLLHNAQQKNSSMLKIKSHVLLPQIVTPVTPLEPVYPKLVHIKLLPEPQPVKNISKLRYRILPPPKYETTPYPAINVPKLKTSAVKYKYTQYTTPAGNQSSLPNPTSTVVVSALPPIRQIQRGPPRLNYYSKPPQLYSSPPPPPSLPYKSPPSPFRYYPLMYTTPAPQAILARPEPREQEGEEDPYHWRFLDQFNKGNDRTWPVQKHPNVDNESTVKDSFYYEDTKLMLKKKQKTNGIFINGRGTSGEVLKYKYTLLDGPEARQSHHNTNKHPTTTTTTKTSTTTRPTTVTSSTPKPTMVPAMVESQNQRPMEKDRPEQRSGGSESGRRENTAEISQERFLDLKLSAQDKPFSRNRKPYLLTKKRNTNKTKAKYNRLKFQTSVNETVKQKLKASSKMQDSKSLIKGRPYYASKLQYKKTTTKAPTTARPSETTPTIDVQQPRPDTGFVSEVGFSNPFGQTPYNFEEFMPLPKIVPYGMFRKHWSSFPAMDNILKTEFPKSSLVVTEKDPYPKPGKQTYIEARPYKIRKLAEPVIKEPEKEKKMMKATTVKPATVLTKPTTNAPAEVRQLPVLNHVDKEKIGPTYSSTHAQPVLPKLVVLKVTPTPSYPEEEFVYKTEDKQLQEHLTLQNHVGASHESLEPFDEFFSQPFPHSDFNPNMFEDSYRKGWESFRKYKPLDPGYGSSVPSYDPFVFSSPVRHPPPPHSNPYSSAINYPPTQKASTTQPPRYLPNNKIIKATFFEDLETEKLTEKAPKGAKWVGKLKVKKEEKPEESQKSEPALAIRMPPPTHKYFKVKYKLEIMKSLAGKNYIFSACP